MTDEMILDHLIKLFPNAHCELNHTSAYELTVAVMLSAQSTDVSVNKVTPKLFARYSNINELAQADVNEIEQMIKTIGLYRNKAKNLKNMAQHCLSYYNGEIPNTLNDLISLPGIGRKSANVILSVWFNIAAIAVDTHVERVAKRLGLAPIDASVMMVETNLMERFSSDSWSLLHHLLIFFGRYKCFARNPDCIHCPFIAICKKDALD